MVLRSCEPLELLPRLQQLQGLGLRHVELAVPADPSHWHTWCGQVQDLRPQLPGLSLGAASVVRPEAVALAVEAGLAYGVAPVLDRRLFQVAQRLGWCLVPGVFSPSEVQRARRWGCRIVKLFPAASLGPTYWASLRQPLGGLPFCIAAGGIRLSEADAWWSAGVDAVALGASLDHPQALAQLHALLARWPLP